jgi:hypothetical protein
VDPAGAGRRHGLEVDVATQYGVVNFVLHSLGFIDQHIAWLSDPRITMTALNIAHIWFGMPFSMILIAAALTSIPREPYEAAWSTGRARSGNSSTSRCLRSSRRCSPCAASSSYRRCAPST